MTKTLRRVPAALSAVVLGAHFYRAGNLAFTFLCLLFSVLPFFAKRPAGRLAVRGVLLAGAGLWVFHAGWLAHARAIEGRPWLRMTGTLLGVAAFTAASAWLIPGAERGETVGSTAQEG